MKRKGNLFNATLIVFSLVIGFVIGISVNFPKTNTENLKGTIGKVNKHRNVNITDEDIQLRSELTTDEQKREAYLNYYAFHYNMVAQLSALVDSAITASEATSEFAQVNPALINSLKTYSKNIEKPRSELLLAVLTLQNIGEVEEAAISTILNNANMAIARLTYNENIITSFTSAAQEFIANNRNEDIETLIKVHDKLSMLQFTKAVITKDKPMIKYYDKHEIFSDVESLGLYSNEALNWLVVFDSERLQAGFPNQNKLESNVSLSLKGASGIFDAQKLENAEALMGVSLLNIEKLGLHSNSVLGSQINGNFDSEQLKACWDTEQLKALWNTEQLGFQTGSF
jgi:hypothetical protein